VEYEQEYIERDGERIGIHVYPFPADADTVAVLAPAMGVPAGFYRRFAVELGRAGVGVVVAELRGTGSSEPKPSRASKYGFTELTEDIGAVLETLKPRRDGRRTVLIGHSLGGQMCLLHLAKDGGSGVDGVALVAVGLPYWRLYGRRSVPILAYIQSIGLVTRVLRVWPGWTFGGRQARGVVRDWAHTSRTGHYPKLDGVDVDAALGRIRTPVLAVNVKGDGLTPGSVMDHLRDKLAGADVVREEYAVADTELDHFTWVRSSAPLAKRIADWSRALTG
jgi:predicted alpha/beta hydrolase